MRNNLTLSLFCLILSMIFILGLLMIFSTTSGDILDSHSTKGIHSALFKQIGYALAGLGLAYLVQKIGYEKILKNSPSLLLGITFLLFLTLVPGIGREVNGSKRWISFMGLSFQPSEFAKVIIPAYFIHTYMNIQEPGFKSFFKIGMKASFPLLLILIEPNNGTVFVIGLTLIAAFWLMELPFKFWGLPILLSVLLGGVFAAQLPYVQKRLKVYLNPELDIKGKGHQPHQAKIAAGSGGLLGKGPAKSLQKLSYLPEAQNDYIAAIFAEEYGFLGMLFLILLYMGVLSSGTIALLSVNHPEGYVLGGCILFLFTFQAFMNLGVVSSLLPSTGLNLPFFSQGGTNLMANITFASLFLDIGKKCVKEKYC